MKITYRLLLAASLASLALTACNKQEEAKTTTEEAAPAIVAAPTNDDKAAWQEYLKSVALRNMEGVNNAPFAYFLPGESSADFAGEYDRLLERVQGDLSRGIVEGNMLMFGSPSSAKMADLIVTGFREAKPGTMKNVKVLYVGDPADKDRVQAAVAPAGVNFVFVSSK